MRLIGAYKNGNYRVKLYEDGTKIRYNDEDKLTPAFAESFDLTICNRCDLMCPMCYQNSTPDGALADILHEPFLNTLHPFTEVAIGGGNPLAHPDLTQFLIMLQAKKVVANLTVNAKHLEQHFPLLCALDADDLVHGVGVSMQRYDSRSIELMGYLKNPVVHVIAGITPVSDIEMMLRAHCKVLVLGFKDIGRGTEYLSNPTASDNVASGILELAKSLKKLIPLCVGGAVLSFDNLAILQLRVRAAIPAEMWERFYMGDDGEFTMYVDLVKREFARSSIAQKRYPLRGDIDEMFETVRRDHGLDEKKEEAV